MNPRIEIDGNRAKVFGISMGPFTFRKDNGARWITVRYEDDYVKVNGEWKDQHLRTFVRFVAVYELGWAKKG